MKIRNILTNRILCICLCMLFFLMIKAQTKSFGISVSKDTLLYGNVLKVEFTMENIKGKFEAPDFKDFEILSGPNTSSSMYSINGETTSKSIYNYFIKPKKVGVFFIENAYLIIGKEDDKNMETSPYKIVVLENPQGISEEVEDNGMNSMFFSFPSGGDLFNQQPPTQREENKATAKPKRKLKRI